MTEPGIGLELIQLETLKILINNLNDEIENQETLWGDRDKELNQLTGVQPIRTKLESVKEENFHSGHRPSLVLSPPKPSYPNISVMAYRANPLGEQIDQADNFTVTIDIEGMVKSNDNEVEVDRRCHRMVEAVHQVLIRHEDLGGTSFGWQNEPVVQITDIFTRREEKGHGKDWYWQAFRLRWQISRNNYLPSL